MTINILTYNEALTKICDFFDGLISPKTISRSNTNIVYLVLKAFAKGWEIINNVLYALSNKFDPANCSDEDLVSVSALVGTDRLKGSATGLSLTITNPTDNDLTLTQGVYYYDLDADTRFIFELTEDMVIASHNTNLKEIIAMSEKIGSYPVTYQSDIKIKGVLPAVFPSDLKCSCWDNSELLGIAPENLADFRQRILTDVHRQDVISELEVALKNLPFLFDCKVKFNPSSVDILEYDGINIPPLHMAIFYSGSPRSEIADTVASKVFYPTVSTADSVTVKHMNDCFANGEYAVNIIPMKQANFGVVVTYTYDESFITDEDIRYSIMGALFAEYHKSVHRDFVKENDIYNLLNALNLSGVNILNVDLYVNGSVVPYIEVKDDKIAWVDTVTLNP